MENTLMSIALWDCLIGFAVPEIWDTAPWSAYTGNTAVKEEIKTLG